MTDPVVLLSTGDVIGPNSATSGTMVLFDGTSGKKIKGNNAVVTQQGLNLLDDVDAASNRATIGLNLVNNTSDINKPVSTAQQTALDLKATVVELNAGLNTKASKGANSDITSITGLTTMLPATQGGTGVSSLPLLKSALALNLVTNTSDVNKPVSTAQQAALNTKADKATTLAGYNITDGLPNLMPSAGTNYALQGSQYVFMSATNIAHMCQNAVWNGTQWNRVNTALPGIVVLAMNGQLYIQPFLAGANPIAFPNTYPVINSSNVATESAAGVLAIATQPVVEAGTNDSTAVTPKKLRLGVSMSLGPTGFLALPSWLGGVIFNWGRTQITDNGQRITFSKAYPTEVFLFLPGTGVDNSGQLEVMNPVPNSLTNTGININASQATEYPWLAIGR